MSGSGALYRDPHWPRASEWLAAGSKRGAALTVIGAPVAKGSITPGRCDLAPSAVRAALARYSTYDVATRRDLRNVPVFDAGDLPVAELSPEDAFLPIRDAVAGAHGIAVILGGDNSITRPGVHGLGLALERCGLLTFDAHYDLRSLDGGLTNGNPVRALLRDGLPGPNIVQVGIQSFANSWDYAEVAREEGILAAESAEQALDYLARRVDAIYVDLDLDVMDRAFVPGTPGSRPGGLTPGEMRREARACGSHPLVRAMDLVEMDPAQDVASVTSLTAAACLLEFVCGVMGRTGAPESL